MYSNFKSSKKMSFYSSKVFHQLRNSSKLSSPFWSVSWNFMNSFISSSVTFCPEFSMMSFSSSALTDPSLFLSNKLKNFFRFLRVFWSNSCMICNLYLTLFRWKFLNSNTYLFWHYFSLFISIKVEIFILKL